jgi:hypothetical protein
MSAPVSTSDSVTVSRLETMGSRRKMVPTSSGKAGRADDLEVEGLVPHHDRVVALGLFDQAGELAPQGLVFGYQFAHTGAALVHGSFPLSN